MECRGTSWLGPLDRLGRLDALARPRPGTRTRLLLGGLTRAGADILRDFVPIRHGLDRGDSGGLRRARELTTALWRGHRRAL